MIQKVTTCHSTDARGCWQPKQVGVLLSKHT